MSPFSFFTRKNNIEELQTTTFDLLIVGGGITGAGIALDAASRGMKVALIAEKDFASEANNESTKLIHDGFRYSKEFPFSLVKEAGAAREIVHRLAPHLAVPEKIILPVIDSTSAVSWLTPIGLKTENPLAATKDKGNQEILSKSEALKKEPLLLKSIINGAGYSLEYKADDARMALEVLKTALNYDAKIINYTAVTEFIYEENKIVGATVKEGFTQKSFDIKAKYLVQTSETLLHAEQQTNPTKTGKHLQVADGIHLAVAHEKLPVKQSVYFELSDGSMVFAIPHGKVTYVGTTNTNYKQDQDNIKGSFVRAAAVIAVINTLFSATAISLEDVQSSWIGLRPLTYDYEKEKPASELSKKDVFFDSDTGLISIANRRLTGYRKTAERIVDLITKKHESAFGTAFKQVQTAEIILSGGAFANFSEVRSYVDAIHNRIAEVDFNERDAEYLIYNYGTQTDIILQKFDDLMEEDQPKKMIKAEVWFCIHYEMTCTPSDFFARRTNRLFFDIESVFLYKEFVLTEFKNYFSWNEKTTKKHQQELEEQLTAAIALK